MSGTVIHKERLFLEIQIENAAERTEQCRIRIEQMLEGMVLGKAMEDARDSRPCDCEPQHAS